MMSVEIVRHVLEPEWNHFLEDDREATIYHTPEWKRFLECTFGYSSQYLFAIDECGKLMGMLPLFHVKSRLTGNRLCTVPFSHECGILGDQEIRTALINEAIDVGQHFNTGVLEIRSPVEDDRFSKAHTFNTYIVDLPEKPAELSKILRKRTTRAQIRKSETAGVNITTSSTIESIKEFYELNRITKQKLGVPCHPWNFIKNLFSTLDGHVHLYLASHNEEIIAGGIMMSFKDQFLAGYAAADPTSYHLFPYYALFWKSITDAYENDYRTYDLGRVHIGDAGLTQFKRNWSPRQSELWYSYSPRFEQPFSGRDSSIYRLSNTVLRHMPMSVYTRFSEGIFTHFG
jgi:hypothetical protein